MSKGFKNGLKKVGRVWHYKFKMHGQLHHGSTRCESLEDARKFLFTLRNEKAKEPLGLGEPPTIEALYQRYVREKASLIQPSTMVSFRSGISRWVIPIIGKIRVDRLKLSDLADVTANYLKASGPNGKPHARGGARQLMINTRTLLNYAVKTRLVTHLPLRVELPKAPKKAILAISSDRLLDFTRAVDNYPCIPKHVALGILTMLFMGLRISELTSMRWGFFGADFEQYTPTETKGREADAIPIIPELSHRFREWKEFTKTTWAASGKPMPQWVFWSKKGKHYGNSFTNRWIKKITEELGLPGNWSPHKLRASCATILNQLGVPSITIQSILRHKDLGTTLHYTRLDHKTMRAGLVKMGSMAFPSEPKAETPSSELIDLRALVTPSDYTRIVLPLVNAGMPESEAIVIALRVSGGQSQDR